MVLMWVPAPAVAVAWSGASSVGPIQRRATSVQGRPGIVRPGKKSDAPSTTTAVIAPSLTFPCRTGRKTISTTDTSASVL